MQRYLAANIKHEESPVGGFSIFTEVYVSGEKLADILDIEVFYNAIKNSGLYPLFTCECGCFGCGQKFSFIFSIKTTKSEVKGLFYNNYKKCKLSL